MEKNAIVSLIGLLLSALAGYGQDLQITSPVSGSVIEAGKTFQLIVEVPAGQSVTEVLLFGELLSPGAIKEGIPGVTTYTFDIRVPSNARRGRTQFNALATVQGSNGGLVSGNYFLVIEGSSGSQYLVVDTSSIELAYVGAREEMWGHLEWSDGSRSGTAVVDWDRISVTSSNPNVAFPEPEGVVVAKAPGSAVVTVSYRSDSFPIPVVVQQSAVLGDLDVDGDVDSVDVLELEEGLGTSGAVLNDARDLNRDGAIDNVDRSIQVGLCTRPRCATSSDGRHGILRDFVLTPTPTATPTATPTHTPTATPTLTPTPAPACVDSDGGKNLLVFGTVSYKGSVLRDNCFGAKVQEAYCDASNVGRIALMSCPAGKSCKLGLCQ